MRDTAVIEKQCGALPVRRVDGRLEVLLVSSRETRRWVIPKGWLIDGLSVPAAAAREAFEEAGVEGRIGGKPLGFFAYGKRMKNGALQACQVEVFRLDVRSEHDAWPEAHQRNRKWMTPDAAADLVAEPELAALIRSLS